MLEAVSMALVERAMLSGAIIVLFSGITNPLTLILARKCPSPSSWWIDWGFQLKIKNADDGRRRPPKLIG
jgi:hypothetical protein